MKCWHCEEPATGVCRFCGRFVCKDHCESMPYVLTAYRTEENKTMALTVEDVLYCGICRPRGAPMELESLD